MAQFTDKQLRAQAKTRANAEKRLARQANTQQGLVNYGQHQKSDWRHSTNDQAVRYPKFDEQQQQILNNLSNLLSGGINNLAIPGSNALSFAPIKEEAQRRFNQEGIPTIAERFQSLGGQDGSGGALSSPDLYKQLGGARAQLDSQLAALEAQYGLQQRGLESGNLFNLLSAGLSPRFDTGVIPGQDSGLRQVFNQLKGVIPGALSGGLLGGASGAGYGALSGLGLGQVGNALQQRNQPQTIQNSAGFTPQQGVGFGYNSPLGTGGINSSILDGYSNSMLPSSNQYLFPTQF